MLAHGPLGRSRCRPMTADRADQPEGGLVNGDTRSSVECSQSGGTEHVSDADDAGEDQDGRLQHRPGGNRQLPPAPEHQPEQDHGGDHGDLLRRNHRIFHGPTVASDEQGSVSAACRTALARPSTVSGAPATGHRRRRYPHPTPRGEHNTEGCSDMARDPGPCGTRLCQLKFPSPTLRD